MRTIGECILILLMFVLMAIIVLYIIIYVVIYTLCNPLVVYRKFRLGYRHEI